MHLQLDCVQEYSLHGFLYSFMAWSSIWIMIIIIIMTMITIISAITIMSMITIMTMTTTMTTMIITPQRWILTAAHCVSGKPNNPAENMFAPPFYLFMIMMIMMAILVGNLKPNNPTENMFMPPFYLFMMMMKMTIILW